MKLNFIALLLSIATVFSAAAYNISGTVLDEESMPLIKATVRVLNTADSTAIKGAITNDKGEFRISDISNGKYILEASYVGYQPIHQDITIKGQNLKVGQIRMSENAEMLRDVTVTGIRTPIKVMEDTIEFNADSYKTKPNAVVEDLLKRLPGVEVGTDGSITANGKTVTKILVDGKEFFSDDPTVASKNLPVDMIDKLQVVDRKSDLARMTGVDDGEEETVINLTVKKGMNNGWFGNAEAGYGTDSRYSGNFNINHFFNGNQLTILGGANNINNMGAIDGGGRFGRFGGFGGITKSQMLGLNFNIGKEEIIRVGGDVSYMHTDRDVYNKTSRQYLFPDSTSFYDSERRSNDRGHNIRANFRVEWKPDSFNTLDFRPNVRVNINDSESQTASNTFAGIPATGTPGAQVNKSLNSQMSHGTGYDFGGRLIYNHNFKGHKGRSFSISANYSFSNQREKSNTYSWNRFYNLLMQDDPYNIYDQYTNNHTWSNSVQSRVSWTEPLGNVKNGNFLELSYNFSYRWNNADKMVYNRSVPETETPQVPSHLLDELLGDEFNSDLSNRFRNNYMNQNIRVGFRHVDSKTNLNVGLSLVPQMSQSTDLINSDKSIPRRNVLNYAPFLRYRLKMTKTRSLNIDYNGRSSQPSMSQLQPVADYSDPLNVIQGNPDLDPSFNHNMRLRFQDFNQDAQRSIMVMLNASMTQNSIVQRTRFDSETGGRFTTYENVNGIWNLFGFSMFSVPFKNKTFTFNNSLGGGYSHNVGYTSAGPNNFVRNNSGNLNIRESFGIAWRPEYIEIELRPNYSLQYTSNSVQKSANKTVHGFGGTLYGSFYTSFGLSFNTDLTYTANRGYTDGFNKNEWMWNAGISYAALKDQSLTFTLRASDILQQRSNINRNVTANYIEDSLTNTLSRYVMFSVSYRFNSFSKGQQPEFRDGMWGGHQFGPPGGGPGGPGGRGGHR